MAEDGGSARKTRKLDRSARAVARLSQGVNDVSNKTRYECLETRSQNLGAALGVCQDALSALDIEAM